jgi:hypothetical protein
MRANLHQITIKLTDIFVDQLQECQLNREDENRHQSDNLGFRPQASPPKQTSWQCSSDQLGSPEISLPQYLKAIPSKYTNEDLEYLQIKGAFVVPERDLRNALLRCYAQHVHPYMPVIDLREFLSSIERNRPDNTVSLLLFQAVMFAAVTYIDMRFLKAHGFVSRRSARRAYYQRVKLLYDLDYEFDRLTCLQAVLLMSYWHENPDEPKDVWNWLGVAVSLCRTIGINCDTSNDRSFSPEKRRLWKRIWWSCYIRDRLVAIALRRSTRIGHSDFDVPMLELSDFETVALPAELVRMLGGCSAVKDTSIRKTLAAMCIELARLCVCISEVITAQYSVASNKAMGHQNITTVSATKNTPADPGDIIRCDRQLEQWYKELPPNLQFFPSEAQAAAANNGCKITYVHQAILKGLYLTAMSALHRPQSLPSSADVAPELRQFSIRKIRESADHIVNMYDDLRAQDLIRYLPNTGVTCLVPAIIVFLGDIKSSHPSTRQAGLRKTQVCREALQALQDMYASAELACASLESALRRTKFTITPTATASIPPHTSHPPKAVTQDTVQQSVFMVPSPPWSDRAADRASFSSVPVSQEGEALTLSTPRETERTMNDSLHRCVASSIHNLGPVENHQTQCQAEHHQSPTHSVIRSKSLLTCGFDKLSDEDPTADYALPDSALGGDLNMQWLNWMDVTSNGGSSTNGDLG